MVFRTLGNGRFCQADDQIWTGELFQQDDHFQEVLDNQIIRIGAVEVENIFSKETILNKITLKLNKIFEFVVFFMCACNEGSR